MTILSYDMKKERMKIMLQTKLFKVFITKEKIFLILITLLLICLSLLMVYQKSIYSHEGYFKENPQGALSLYYYFHCIGINPYLFFLMMLLIPNLTGYDFLNIHQNHAAYLIETRLTKKQYYHQCFIFNILFSTLITLFIELFILAIIHFSIAPICFNTTTYPENYYVTAQILSSNECLSLIGFVLLTSIGYGLVSSLTFSLQIFISNKYIYRCFGVIFGILLVLIPALIQGYLPIPEAAFILQINNLVALGMENVRANAFHLPHIGMYIYCFLCYAIASIGCFYLMKKWRHQYDS